MSSPQETDTARLLRLLEPNGGRHVEDGMIVRVDGQLVLRMDGQPDRPLATLEHGALSDLLCQLRGHSGW